MVLCVDWPYDININVQRRVVSCRNVIVSTMGQYGMCYQMLLSVCKKYKLSLLRLRTYWFALVYEGAPKTHRDGRTNGAKMRDKGLSRSAKSDPNGLRDFHCPTQTSTRLAIMLPSINMLLLREDTNTPHTPAPLFPHAPQNLLGPVARKVLIEICLVNKNCINKILRPPDPGCVFGLRLSSPPLTATATEAAAAVQSHKRSFRISLGPSFDWQQYRYRGEKKE